MPIRLPTHLSATSMSTEENSSKQFNPLIQTKFLIKGPYPGHKPLILNTSTNSTSFRNAENFIELFFSMKSSKSIHYSANNMC
jgi:hypothetical protein